MYEVIDGKKVLTTPVSAEDLKNINIGDIVYLNGDITTCRDVAHRRVVEYGRELPVDVNPALRRRDAAAVFHHVDAAQIHAVKGEHCISGVRSALAAAALSRRRAGQQVHFSADISGSRRAGQKYNQHDPRRYR